MLRLFVILLIPSFISIPAKAGNPSIVEVSTQTPVGWNTESTIKYKIDNDSLGRLTFDQAKKLIELSLSVWESVEGTGIEFEYVGQTDADVTGSNVEEYSTYQNGVDEDYLIFIFDNDGTAFDEAFGSGAHSSLDGANVLAGISGDSSNVGYITGVRIFINGLIINGIDEDSDDERLDKKIVDVMGIIVHEIGHALGLNHTMAAAEFYQNRHYNYVPTMFPTMPENCGEHRISLHPDDIATLKWIYGGDVKTIEGTVVNSSGEPQEAIITTFRSSSSPLCRVYEQASGFLCRSISAFSNYCDDDEALGEFVIPVLENDTYYGDAQKYSDDLSVMALIGYFYKNTNPIPGGAEFYNESDVADEDEFTLSTIDVSDSISGIEFVLASDEYSDDNPEQVYYDYFTDAAFSDIILDDEYCPEVSDIDIAALIGAEEIQTGTCLMINLSENSSNESEAEAAASSCSLNSKDKSGTSGFDVFMASLFFLTIFWGYSLILRRKMGSTAP